jgi:UDP:flavonoid glycosyltransferase YjiC (YdhE family)
VAKIRQAVRDVLDEPRFRAKAARLASGIADDRSTADLVTELEALAR